MCNQPLHPEVLTWTGLLARWIDLAKASLALPKDAQGDRWRQSVPHIINLQAVTFALNDLARLVPEDRPHGRDRAAVLIEQSDRALGEVWDGAHAPAMIVEIANDARSALASSTFAGLTELIWPGPGEMVMPRIKCDLSTGSVAMMQPGTLAIPGEPIVWWCDRHGNELRAALPSCVENEPDGPRQVYRVFDDAGRIERDVIASIDDDPPENGFPLLVPLIHQGERIGEFTLDAKEWEQRQRYAMREAIPVVEFQTDAAEPEIDEPRS